MPTLFSVVAGVDDILLDEGTGCGQRDASAHGRRRCERRGLYWVEEEKLGAVASGHQSAQGSSPSASLATAATASSRSLVNWREVSP